MSEVHSLSAPADAPLRPQGGEDLGAKVASRICHDLANPLGAIANGLELLLLSGLEPSPEMSLLQDSVASASARIRWFRLAFGPAGPQRVGRAEVTDILRAISRGTRLSYDWTVEGDAPRGEVKAVFLLLQCLEAALPLGGRLTISRSDDEWEVTAQSPRLRFDPSLWASLTSAQATRPDTPALVQFALLPETLAELGRNLQVEPGADQILARF